MESMSMEEADPFSDLPEKKPCRCEDEGQLEIAGGEDDPLSDTDLETALLAIEQVAPAGDDSTMDALEQAVADLEGGSALGVGASSLEDLIALAAQHPGLKVTFSF